MSEGGTHRRNKDVAEVITGRNNTLSTEGSNLSNWTLLKHLFTLIESSVEQELNHLLLLCCLAGLNEQMKAVRKRNETSVIDQIGEDLLTWVN